MTEITDTEDHQPWLPWQEKVTHFPALEEVGGNGKPTSVGSDIKIVLFNILSFFFFFKQSHSGTLPFTESMILDSGS